MNEPTTENCRDTIFDSDKPVGDFTFNREVADVFDEMLDRSVPFYAEMQRMVAETAKAFVQDGSRIYDLGCSTGTTVLGILSRLADNDVEVVGVDNSEAMLEHARRRLQEKGLAEKCHFRLADLSGPVSLDSPAVVTMILTLQFIRPAQREFLIKHIYDQLLPGGCLILVEKTIGADSITNRLFIDLYHKFKQRNGYSELEIARKREALENVLIPYTREENRQLLRRNGFSIIDLFFSWYNFSGFLAVKQRNPGDA